MNKKAKKNLAIIIIAAGSSSRLGQPKQLVEFNDVNLLQRITILATSLSDNVSCILGYQAEVMQKKTSHLNIRTVINKIWQQGMGTSIALGVEQQIASVDGVLILLCDQWLIEREDLVSLINCWQRHPHKIIASRFKTQLNLNNSKNAHEINGSPAIFPSSYFEKLKTLKNSGAKKLLQNNSEVVTVNLNNAQFDLDTPEDLKKLKESEKQKKL
jgi:molybdenum cofactor cytidylyltransferase